LKLNISNSKTPSGTLAIHGGEEVRIHTSTKKHRNDGHFFNAEYSEKRKEAKTGEKQNTTLQSLKNELPTNAKTFWKNFPPN